MELTIPTNNTEYAADNPALTSLEAALDYAQHGYFLYPIWHVNADRTCACGNRTCRTPGKHPLGILVPRGVDNATTDPQVIRLWYQRHPYANIGIALEPSGLVSVAPDSVDWRAKFMRRQLPETWSFRSGGGDGHEHYLYRRPEGCPAHRICKSGEYDIMSAGGVVAPPSRHSSGRRYESITSVMDVGALPEAPAWVVDQLKEAAVSRTEQANRSEPDTDEPPVRLDEEDLKRWRGEEVALKRDGEIDRSETLYVVGERLARHNATARTIADAVAECDERFARQGIFDEPCYADRRDAEERYRAIAMKAVEKAEDDRRQLKHLLQVKLDSGPPRGEPSTGVTRQRRHTSTPSMPQIRSASDLLRADLPETRFAVPGLLPVGASILGGKPKTGKSWLALQLSMEVASGGEVLGQTVEQGDVLYLALEDNDARLKSRMSKLLGDVHEDPFTDSGLFSLNLPPEPERLQYATHWSRLDEGGLGDLEEWLRTHPQARLVIVDTLARVRPRSIRNSSVYADDYGAVSGLQDLAGEVRSGNTHRHSPAEDVF